MSEPTRGLLLLRVRDNIRDTTLAYKHMYESAVRFSMKKFAEADVGMNDLKDRIKELKARDV